VVGLLRRSPHVAIAWAEVDDDIDDRGRQGVRLNVERWVANPADEFDINTEQDTGTVFVTDCSGAGPHYLAGGRYLLFFDDRMVPDFEGGYQVAGGGLTPNSTWGAPRDLEGLSEAEATQRIDTAARFVRGEGANYTGRGPAEQLLHLALPDGIATGNPEPRLHRLAGVSRQVFIGTVVGGSVDEGWDGVPATRVRLRVDQWVIPRNDGMPVEVEVLQYGARTGRWVVEAETEPLMSPGDQFLVFYGRHIVFGDDILEVPGFARYLIQGGRLHAVHPDWLQFPAVGDLVGLTVDEAITKVRAARGE
jgi:hypothetical protein